MPAKAGRRENPIADEPRLERTGVGSWRVCNSRVARGKGRFLAFIDEMNNGFEAIEVTDDFVRVQLPTMPNAFAPVVRTTGRAKFTELEARTS